jgi:hypothetical protein
MGLKPCDVCKVLRICQTARVRVRYGVLGAAIIRRAGRPNAQARHYGQATATIIDAHFDGKGPIASWAVGRDGHPTDYGALTSPPYDPNWTAKTILYNDVPTFLKWLDQAVPGWDRDLQST